MKILKSVTIALIVSFVFSGCLTVERKEYKFELTGNGKGKLTITYYNIESEKEEGKNVSLKDFGELIDDYLNGNKSQESFPYAKIVEKTLYEQDGKLCGKLVLEFDKLDDINLYQHSSTGLYMFYFSSATEMSESVESTNGEYGGEKMPVIMWPKKTNELIFATRTEVSSYMPVEKVTLLDKYRKWKEDN
jgi:hypothetical protein